ncbi:hypothetical protein [Autumnicola psychrophila]|uniref:DUF5077 domain-containing protein n=1 Tax=Autumnicola psychrophila TaxID=3075592 RepID=A0ABU3DPC4_9FLAO|nr:hypothetical protein [Zunongwangia sp. F225]MDT0685571.1 hypothetical protein [Zunongwangia sp. F225]
MRANFLKSFVVVVGLFISQASAQSIWSSSTQAYSIEVPKGFKKTTAIGQNVDFKAENGSSSIIVVVKALPAEYAQYSIWEIMGDLNTYGDEWEYGAREYMNNPQFLKYGKTKVDGHDAFWYNYTTDSPKMYSKVYQTQKGRYTFTFTLTSHLNQYNSFSPIWFRFKENIQL